MVRKNYPEVQLVEFDRNTGAYRGRNEGVTASKGRILFFLDDGTTLERSPVSEIMNCFSTEESLEGCSTMGCDSANE